MWIWNLLFTKYSSHRIPTTPSEVISNLGRLSIRIIEWDQTLTETVITSLTPQCISSLIDSGRIILSQMAKISDTVRCSVLSQSTILHIIEPRLHHDSQYKSVLIWLYIPVTYFDGSFVHVPLLARKKTTIIYWRKREAWSSLRLSAIGTEYNNNIVTQQLQLQQLHSSAKLKSFIIIPIPDSEVPDVKSLALHVTSIHLVSLERGSIVENVFPCFQLG